MRVNHNQEARQDIHSSIYMYMYIICLLIWLLGGQLYIHVQYVCMHISSNCHRFKKYLY